MKILHNTVKIMNNELKKWINSNIICHYGLSLTLHQFYSHTTVISSLQRKQQQPFWLALIPHVKVVSRKKKKNYIYIVIYNK